MEFIYVATLVVVIIIGTLVYPYWKDNRIYFGLLITGFGLALLYIIHNRDTVIEHLQISGEAVQNVGSIYNQNKMIVKDLEVTGQLTANNLTAETMLAKNTLAVIGSITGEKEIFAKGNLTVDGSITGKKQIIANNGFKSNNWYIEPVGKTKNRLRFMYDKRDGLADDRPFVKGMRPFTVDYDTRIYDKWDNLSDYNEDKEDGSKSMMYAYGSRDTP